MSIVMYCWRIKKGDFWPTTRKLRQDAFDNHSAMHVASEIRQRLLKREPGFNTFKAQAEWDQVMKEIYQADETGLLALQIFDEGRTFLIRPIYFNMNFREAVKRLELPLKGVWYDGRVGEGSRGGEAKADWLDDKISSGEYFIYVVLGTQEPFKAIIYNIWPKGIKHSHNSGP